MVGQANPGLASGKSSLLYARYPDHIEISGSVLMISGPYHGSSLETDKHASSVQFAK